MTLKEAKMTIYTNVVYACEKAGLSPCTTAMVKDACDTVIELAEQADTPQTEVEDGEDYLRGYNDGYYARGILDKAGVEIHIDKPRGFSLMSPSDKSQTDCPWK